MSTVKKEKDYLCNSVTQEHYRTETVGYGTCGTDRAIY